MVKRSDRIRTDPNFKKRLREHFGDEMSFREMTEKLVNYLNWDDIPKKKKK